MWTSPACGWKPEPPGSTLPTGALVSCPHPPGPCRVSGSVHCPHPPELVVGVAHLAGLQLGHENEKDTDEDEEVDLCVESTAQGNPQIPT